MILRKPTLVLSSIVTAAGLLFCHPVCAVSDSSWDNYFSMAQAATKQSDWNKAQQFWRLCVQEADDTGSDFNRVVPSLLGLGNALTQLDRVGDAQAVYQRAYDFLLKEKGPSNIATVNAMLDLASCMESQGKNKKAEQLYNRVFEIGTSSSDNTLASHVIHRSASYYGRSGKLDKSEEAYRSAIAKTTSSDAVQLARMRVLLQEYSEVLKRNNKQSDADAVEKRVLALAPVAPLSTAGSRIAIPGQALTQSSTQNSTQTSLQTSTQASPQLSNPRSNFGADLNAQTQSGFSNQQNEADTLISSSEPVGNYSMFATLSEVSAGQKRYEEAEPLYKKVIQIDETSLGVDHPGLAADLSNLALLYTSQGKYSEAIPLFSRALTIYKKAYGDNNLAVLDCKLNLANAYSHSAQSKDAEKLYLEALVTSQALAGPGRLITAKIYNRLGYFYYLQSRFAEAEAIYAKALVASEDAYGPNSRLLGACCEDYARVMKALGKSGDASALEGRAKQIFAIAGAS